MTLKAKTATALYLSALALSACGGSNVAGIASIFASEAIISEADYLGQTFPVRYIGVDEGTSELKRGTETVRFISASELAVSIDGINETIIEIDPVEYAGPSLLAFEEIYAPELTTFSGGTETALYGGFLGFETATADIPTSDAFWYDSFDGSSMIFTNGDGYSLDEGGVYLTVNFGSGAVTGDLFFFADGDGPGDVFAAIITDGQISGNGITGGVQIEDFGVFPTTTNDDLSGVFLARTQPCQVALLKASFPPWPAPSTSLAASLPKRLWLWLIDESRGRPLSKGSSSIPKPPHKLDARRARRASHSFE